MSSMKTNPLFQQYFVPNYIHKITSSNTEYSFEFANVVVADLPIQEQLYIQGTVYSVPELVQKIHSIHIGYAISELFVSMSANGNLVGTVAILLNQKPLASYEQIGEVRVDGGKVQLANGDLSSYGSIDDVDAAKVSQVEKTVFSYAGIVDSISFVEVQAGYGDGTYPIYLAKDTEGVPCALYIDFLLFDRPDILEKLIV